MFSFFFLVWMLLAVFIAFVLSRMVRRHADFYDASLFGFQARDYKHAAGFTDSHGRKLKWGETR